MHKRDIVDISWSVQNPYILASVSHDKLAILWDIRDIKPLYIFIMPSVVTSISFCPSNEDFLATGSLDKITRIWSIKHKTVVDWVEVKDVISAVSYSLDGERLVVGTLKGIIMVFDTTSKLMQIGTIKVKNRFGVFSSGRKVTDIKFITNRKAILTTCDSRVREIDLTSMTQTAKFKGHKNEEYSLKADMSEDENLIVSPSEDGHVFIWQRNE